MRSLQSEAELLRCFREIDRGEVELPSALRFPVEVDGYLAWSAGPRAFLIYVDKPNAPARGIVFKRSTEPTPDVAAMCDWCHAVRSHGGVKLLTARRDERHQVGLHLCADLGCLRRREEPPTVDDFHEAITPEERNARIVARISTFAQRRLF